jgi:hypothetical protein
VLGRLKQIQDVKVAHPRIDIAQINSFVRCLQPSVRRYDGNSDNGVDCRGDEEVDDEDEERRGANMRVGGDNKEAGKTCALGAWGGSGADKDDDFKCKSDKSFC